MKEEINGIIVNDPYRWLENAEDPKTQKWTKEQNEGVNTSLKDDSFNKFSEKLVKNFKVTNFSNPIPVNGVYFYTERQPEQDQAVLYMKKGLTGNPAVLFDPNGKREGNTITIDFWQVSSTGKYISYGISEGGNEMATLFVKEVETNEDLAEKISNCRYSRVSWLPDDSGFFYTRTARPGSVPKNEEHLHEKIFFHTLGDNSENDKIIFGADRPKDDMVDITLSPDGRYLGIQASTTWTENEIYLYDSETEETNAIVKNIPSRFSIRFLEDKILLDTNYKANNFRVLVATISDAEKSIDEWQEFITEKDFMMESISITKSKVLVEYLVNVCSEVVILDYEGKETGKIPLPHYSSLAGISCRSQEEEFFYGVQSFTFPKILYRYDSTMKEYTEFRTTDNPINPNDYEVKQEWYESKDGTKVPIFIFHKKGIQLNGMNPTILTAYGGFGVNEVPTFMKSWVPWIEKEGVFAMANIRGGGEFGEKWHKGGIKENKQNSFDDFIAAGEYLIAQKYTDNDHLGIIGGSNGGLLVSAVAVQQPDLFKAVCSQVPLTDMVRFPKFGMALRWVHEYGNPEVKEDLEYILKWSPYHNVKEGVKYPSFLFTTANKDTRVDPLHARKMAAIIQGISKKNNVLVFTEMEAGHGPGKPIVKIVEGQALVLSFFSKELSLNN